MNASEAAWTFSTMFEKATTAESLHEDFSAFTAEYGVSYCGLGELANPYQPKSPLVPIFVSSWPSEWEAYWMAKNYRIHDPVILYALNGTSSFFWRDIRPHQHGLAARIMDEGCDFGLRDGLCIPIHRPGHLPAAVSLSGDRLVLSPEEQKLLQLCAIQVFDKLERLMRPDATQTPPQLTPREREALHWIAAGKTIPIIADILTLSEHTVRDHVKSAMRKLNASTQAQAVAMAIRLGELLP